MAGNKVFIFDMMKQVKHDEVLRYMLAKTNCKTRYPAMVGMIID